MTFRLFPSALSLVAAALLILGCTKSTHQQTDSTSAANHSPQPANSDEAHHHEPGAHGGIIVSLGRDSYHVEAIVTDSGELRLYTLGNDETRVIDIEAQELTAYVKSSDSSETSSISIKPVSQPGDAKGKSSLFVAQLPESLVGQKVDVTVPNITIAGERFRLGFTTATSAATSAATSTHHAEVTSKMTDKAEEDLYLTPGGLYTEADIEANGRMAASKKFRGIKIAHDAKPLPGDKICPISMTKANSDLSWIVGGKTYTFCCPPCVDEFLAMAKTKPDEVKPPDHYIQGGPANEESLESK